MVTPIFAIATGWTIVIVVAVIVLLFGGKKIPELARGLAHARREFKKATDEVNRELDGEEDEKMRREARRKIIEEEERAKRQAELDSADKNNLGS